MRVRRANIKARALLMARARAFRDGKPSDNSS